LALSRVLIQPKNYPGMEIVYTINKNRKLRIIFDYPYVKIFHCDMITKIPIVAVLGLQADFSSLGHLSVWLKCAG
jgi:hypothetical protein